MRGNGFATHNSWISSDDGILTIDRNYNGKIDDINELFGNDTQTGFEALALEDANSDGIIDGNDAVFSGLKVWQDSNGDGISQTDELKSLDYYGITSIGLTNTAVNDTSNNDGKITHTGVFHYSNGATGTVANVALLTDSVQSRYVGEVTIAPDVAAIPNIKGYGLMPDLQIAMSLDENLKTMVMDGLAQLTVQNVNEVFGQILYKWAGVENITLQEIDPNAALAVDPETGKVFFQHADCAFTLQQLGVIKQYSGLDVLTLNDGQWRVEQGVIETTGDYYQIAWESIYNNLLAKFAVANGLVETLLPDAVYDPATDMLAAGFNIQENGNQYFHDVIGNIIQNPQNTEIINQSLLSAMVLFEIDPSSKLQFAVEMDKSLTVSTIADLNRIMETDFYRLLNLDSNDRLDGSVNDDVMNAGHGHNLVFGNAGNDLIYGGSGDDIIAGGTGSDALFGGRGNDAYIYNLGDGEDVIYDAFHDYEDNRNATVNSGYDEIAFGEGISTDNILLSAQGNDLVISFLDSTGDALTIRNFANTANQIETFAFSNGTIWDVRTILSNTMVVEGDASTAWVADYLAGSYSSNLVASDGNDILVGTVDADELSGGNGNDIMWGHEGDDTFIGDDGDDVLIGGIGNDMLDGCLGDDVIVGEAGNDNLWGRTGNDILYGGDGDDTLYGQNDNDVLDGGSGADLIYSGLGADYANGGAGNDEIWGEAGDDTLLGGAGEDIINGVADNDLMAGGDGFDQMYGGTGNDTLYGQADNDVLCGDAGDDALIGGTGDDGLYGGDGQDNLNGEDGNDILQGDGGNDLLAGGLGSDVLSGGDGHDTLLGEAGDDTLWGHAGDDNLSGGQGSDILCGFEDNDTLAGGEGQDALYGGAGNDTLNGEADNDILCGDAGDDLLLGGAGEDGLYGGDGQDLLNGEDGNDVLQGDNGNDILTGGLGNDVLSGNEGMDTLLGEDGDDTLWGHAGDDALFGGSGNDILCGFEDADVLNGNAGYDELYGGAGNDTLYGGDDDDILLGGQGADTMTGEAGADLFAFSQATDSTAEAMDIILDFEQGLDRLDMRALGLTENDFGTALVYDIINGNTIVRDIPSGLAFQLNGEHQLASTDMLFAQA